MFQTICKKKKEVFRKTRTQDEHAQKSHSV
jgi:hypothetical protein